MKDYKESFIQKSGRLLKYMQRRALMLFSIVWVIATAVLLWLLLYPYKKIERVDFVLIESVLVASFCFIVIAKLMRKYRKKSVSLFIDHFSSLCVSIATILTGAGAMICVGIQLYQGITYDRKVKQIESMYRHVNDLYYGMLTTHAAIMYSDSTTRYKAFGRQLLALDKVLKVKLDDYSYYDSIFPRLHKYLKVVNSSAFSNTSSDRPHENIEQYQHYINYLFAQIYEEEYPENIRTQIDSVKKEYQKRIDSVRKSIELQKESTSSYP